MVTNVDVEQISGDNTLAKRRDGWRMVKFGDVVNNLDISERNPLDNGLERYIGLDHIDPESLHIKRWGLIEEGTSFTRKFVAGQVLFGKRRTYQRKVAVAEFAGICSGDILVFEAKADLLPELLPFIVQSDGFYEHALGTSAGSLSPRTRWRDLADYEFALPPKDEQRRIADILWAIEQSSEQFNQCVYKAEQLRRTILSEIILKGINHTEFQNTEIGPIPTSWKITQVRNVGNVQLGRQRAPQYQTGNYSRPYLRVANVFDGYLDLTDVLKMDFDNQDYQKYVLKNGDILINEGQSRELVGRSCIYRGEIEGCCFQNTLIRFQVSDKLLPEFAFGYFQNAFYQEQFAQMARQTTSIAHLGADRFANFLIPVPPIEEQRRIIKYLEVQNQECNHLRNHLNSVAMVKSRLLHHMLSNC